MQDSKTGTDGDGRDEALRRRNGGVREAMGSRPAPTPEADKPEEPKAANDNPSE
jgi:hypothetical protein